MATNWKYVRKRKWEIADCLLFRFFRLFHFFCCQFPFQTEWHSKSSNMLIADIIFIAANLSCWQSSQTRFHAINIYLSFFGVVSHQIPVVRKWVGGNEDRDVDEPCNSNPKRLVLCFIGEIVVAFFFHYIIIDHLTLTYTRGTAYINDSLKINLSLSHVAHTLHRRRRHWERIINCCGLHKCQYEGAIRFRCIHTTVLYSTYNVHTRTRTYLR